MQIFYYILSITLHFVHPNLVKIFPYFIVVLQTFYEKVNKHLILKTKNKRILLKQSTKKPVSKETGLDDYVRSRLCRNLMIRKF